LYMLPETSAAKKVDLYRCTSFPWEWEWTKTLIEGKALVDATLLFYNEKWWLFACRYDADELTYNDRLCIYYTNDLLSGDWMAHAQNPVVTDVSNCRPAGNFIYRDGIWYRPAQNNASRQYGYGVKINKLLVLNETEYKEEEVASLGPVQYREFVAIHTFNQHEGLTVFDGIIKR
jgi:hypothetical protein